MATEINPERIEEEFAGANLEGLSTGGAGEQEVSLAGLTTGGRGYARDGNERDFDWYDTITRWPQALVEGAKEGVRWRAQFQEDELTVLKPGGDEFKRRSERAMQVPDFSREAEEIRARARRPSPSEREGGGQEPERAWADWYIDAGRPEERAKLLTEIDERVSRGEPEAAAREAVATADYEARRMRRIEAWSSVKSADWLQTSPEFDGVTSGYIENVLRSGTSSMPGLFLTAGNPALGLYDIWAMTSGSLSEQIAKQAEARGIDVTDERRIESSRAGGGASAPLEQLGDFFKIGAMFAKGGWTGRVASLFGAGVGEAATEFLQNYPETVAVTWALNPDLKPDQLWAHTQKVIADHDVFMDSVEQAGVGFGAGVLFGAGGQVGGMVLDKFISTNQLAADKTKREFMRDILTTEGEIDPIKSREFVKMIGLDPETMTDDQVKGIVEQVKSRVLNQQSIESEEKNQLRKMLQADGTLPAHVQELYFNLWDGMARVGVEQGLYSRPEEFYTQWVAGIHRSSYAEFMQRTEGEADPAGAGGVAQDQLQLKTLDDLDDSELTRRAAGMRLVIDDGKAKQEVNADEALADMSDRASRLEEIVKCLTS